MSSVDLQAAWICHIFPQYKFSDVEDMGVAEFDRLYNLSQIIRHQLQMDNVMSIATISSKKAVLEVKKMLMNDRRTLSTMHS